MSKVKSLVSKDFLQKNEGDSLEVIEMTEKLKLKIDQFYQHLLNSNFPFDVLCWALAEFNLIFEKGVRNYSEKDVIKRAEKIFDSELNYDTICWLISNIKTYVEEIKLYP